MGKRGPKPTSNATKKLRGTYRKDRDPRYKNLFDEKTAEQAENFVPNKFTESERTHGSISADNRLERWMTLPETIAETPPEYLEEIRAEIAKRRATKHGYGKRYIWGQYYCPDAEWPDGPKNPNPKPTKPAGWGA